MENYKEIRWKQRYEILLKSYKILNEAFNIEVFDEISSAGAIHFFEITFELTRKTMKDFLESEGFIVKSPRETIKQAYQYGIIDNAHILLDALEDRNLATHVYDETKLKTILSNIRSSYLKEIRKIIIFFDEKINS